MTDQISGPAWIPRFLEALNENKQIRPAAKAAGISPGSAYAQRKTNRRFAEAWDLALTIEKTTASIASASPLKTWGWRTSFLEALAETSNVSASAVRANIPVRTVYKLRRTDPDFASKWLAALHEGYDNLEMEVVGYLRDPAPTRKMDVTAALRLLSAHRETVERQRALTAEEDEQATVEALDAFFEGLRQRRLANERLLAAPDNHDEDR